MKLEVYFWLFLIIGLIFIGGCVEIVEECEVDSDCVKATCCHADSCVVKENAPDCSNVFCTLECKSGTMDCGQGSCKCVNGKCKAVFE